MRLTNAIREQIINNAIEQSKVQQDFYQNTVDLYNFYRETIKNGLISAIGKEGIERERVITKELNELITKRTNQNANYDKIQYSYIFKMAFGSEYVYAHLDAEEFIVAYHKVNKLPYPKNIYTFRDTLSLPALASNFLNFTAKEAETVTYTKLTNMQSTLQTEVANLRKDLEAIVYSVNTDSQLLKYWAEGAQFLPKKTAIYKAGLPSVLVKSLNERLGIAPAQGELFKGE